jgi:hypothetical protein
MITLFFFGLSFHNIVHMFRGTRIKEDEKAGRWVMIAVKKKMKSMIGLLECVGVDG